MNEDKATRYHRLGRRITLLSTAVTLCVLSGLLASGLSLWLRASAEGLLKAVHAPGVATAVVGLYTLALALLLDAALLPLNLYKGFVLERRYGLSTETLGHWLTDHLKALGVGLVFAEAAAVFVYAALRHAPQRWWIVASVGYVVVMVGLLNLAPVVLLPMFYRFKPLEKIALRDRLTALAARARTSVRGVYEWTLSDRTRKANAALTGIGNTRRILLSDTLLAEYSDDEIEVILAHELAHHVHHDIWTSSALDAALTCAGFYVSHQLLTAAAASFGLQSTSDPAGLPVLLVAAAVLGLAVKPLSNALSRAHERRADRYALSLTNNPSAFQSAMRRLGQQNLAEDNPSHLVQAFFYTHPPVKDRLRAAQNWGG